MFYIFRNLIKCSRVLQELLDSDQEDQIVSNLIQSLEREPHVENASSFTKYLGPANLSEEQKLSDAYKSLVNHRDPRLQSLFSIWVQNFCVREHFADHDQQKQEKANKIIFSSKPLQATYAIVSHSDGNHEDFRLLPAATENASDREDELGECTPTRPCSQKAEKKAADKASPTLAWLPVFQLDHAESVNKSRVVRSGLRPVHQIVHDTLLEQRLIEDSYCITFSPDKVHALCEERGEGHSLQSSPVGSSNRVCRKKGLENSHEQPASIGKLVSHSSHATKPMHECKAPDTSTSGYKDVQAQNNTMDDSKSTPNRENGVDRVSSKKGCSGIPKKCPKRKAIPSKMLANITRKRRKGQ